MLDNQIIALVKSVVEAQEATATIPGVVIKQAFHPTQQGVNTAPTGYMFKVGDHRLGTPERSDVYDTNSSTIIHTETQQYETMFQMSALSTQDPSNTSQYTSSDILNYIAYCLQSNYAIETFTANGIGIYNVPDVRNPYFMDDRERHQASPSFDFTIVHKQIITSTSNVVQSVNFSFDTV